MVLLCRPKGVPDCHWSIGLGFLATIDEHVRRHDGKRVAERAELLHRVGEPEPDSQPKASDRKPQPTNLRHHPRRR